MVRIAVTGATGFIGSGLTRMLQDSHYEVIALSRSDFGSPVLKEKLLGCDGVIHLAGESIGGIWTSAKRRRIYKSRVDTTRILVDSIIEMKHPLSFFISISAVGIYDTEHVHDEQSSQLANDFLAGVIRDWEAQVCRLETERVRVAILRAGVVISEKGGVLKMLLKPFGLGVGFGINASENFPVIHYTDLLHMFLWVVEHERSSGIYNAVIPEFVSISAFFNKLVKINGKRLSVVFPSWLLRMVMGESSILLTKGQKVLPKHFKIEGFQFTYDNVDRILKACI
jgi:uncharacterized protein